MSTKETKRGRDGTLWNDPDHEYGLPWRRNTAFLRSLREEHGDDWVAEMVAQSEQGYELPPIRSAYRMWIRGTRGYHVDDLERAYLAGQWWVVKWCLLLSAAVLGVALLLLGPWIWAR
jgi:hypothetical protein